MTLDKLKEGTRVTIHSIGDKKVWFGNIRGIAFTGGVFQIYIVQMDQPNPWDYPYSCVTIPDSCLTVLDSSEEDQILFTVLDID